MLLTDEEVQIRLESPLNLLNRLRSQNGSIKRSSPDNIYGIQSPRSEEVIPDLSEKLLRSKTPREQVSDKALALMNTALDSMESRLPEITRPERIASVVRELSQVVKNTEIADVEKSTSVKFTFHIPVAKKEQEYDVIDVS